MTYPEANNLLDQIRSTHPTLFSGTTYVPSKGFWVVHIGPDTGRNQIESPLDWELFRAGHLPEGEPIPANWLYTPKPDADPREELPWTSRALMSILNRLPKPVRKFIWMRMMVPAYWWFAEQMRRLAQTPWLAWMLDPLIDLAWWMPMFPVFLKGLLRAHEARQILEQHIRQGDLQIKDTGEPGLGETILPMPGGGHVHVFTVTSLDGQPVDPNKIGDQIEKTIEKILHEHGNDNPFV